MKSQKQRNKSPRPFKNGSSDGRWGGSQGGGFIPAPNPTSKMAVKGKKKEEEPPAKPASPSSSEEA